MSCITFASLTGSWGNGGYGSGGGSGGGGEGRGGWGGGDGGALPGSGGAPASNVLGDVALNEAPDMVEEVILMDVGGEAVGDGAPGLRWLVTHTCVAYPLYNLLSSTLCNPPNVAMCVMLVGAQA
jgi:hypothetical protein